MSTILKLGGSVITDKEREATLDGPGLDAVCDVVAAGMTEDLVVVHGGGSFGHFAAERHGVSVETGSRDSAAVTDIHGAMKTLNQFVLSRLHERGVSAVPVHPFSSASRDRSGTLTLATEPVATMLAEGFVPVLHGDVVAHEGRGVTILSGDELVVSLAGQLGADRVGLCSTVPGVLDGDGDVIPEIHSFDDVADVFGGTDGTDVTGGMAGKVRSLLALDTPASIFAPESLEEFLAGEAPGTTIG